MKKRPTTKRRASNRKSSRPKTAKKSGVSKRAKLLAIGSAAGKIAHDLNNVLAGVLGFSDLLKRDQSLRPEAKAKVEHLLTAAHRAQGLTKQILDFLRDTPPSLEPVDLSGIANEVSALLSNTLPETVKLKTTCNSSEAKVMGDPTKFHQLLLNLCSNASYALPEMRGEIAIEVASTSLKKPSKKGAFQLPAGEYVTLSVADNGSGIPSQIQEEIFKPFFTTRTNGKGLGLGLASVKSIVESSAGAIDVQSAVGKGSTFTVYLPRLSEKTKTPS